MLSNLYADDVIIFSYDVDGMQCLLVALQTFCQSSEVAVNVDNKNDCSKGHQTGYYPLLHRCRTICGVHIAKQTGTIICHCLSLHIAHESI